MAELRTELENLQPKTSLAEGTELSDHPWETAQNLF